MLLALAGAATLPPPPAPAAVQNAFSRVFNAEDNGAIAIVGNSQLSCPDSASSCAAARKGTGGNVNNNNFVMAFQDVDDVAATTNSTSAQVALPSGSTVLYARLIWGARQDAGGSGVAASGTVGSAKLRSPTQFSYAPVTATTVLTPAIGSHPYQASLDVTSTVAAGGNGTYFFADMAGATGTDVYAGWSLVIAYSNPNLALRDLSVFEGFADISSSAGNTSVSTTVSGFLTPATGNVNATVGVGAWDGDLGSTGDALAFNGATLSDSSRPADNFFDSSIDNFGIPTTDNNPAYANNLGVDFGRVSANGVLANNATSATVNVSTSGETIYLGLLTTEIDLYTPSFAGISKSVTDLNGNSPAQVGDTLEYRLSFVNSGDDTASAVVVRDTLPANVSYVPGSIVVASGAGASTTPKTDAGGDDVGDYVGASRLVRVRLGTGADQATGGTVAPSGSSTVTFRVTLDAASAGSTVSNGGFLDYRAQTLNRNYTFTTNIVSTPVAGIADLRITQVASPASVPAGSTVTYSSTVTNLGPNTASAVLTTNTLPAGETFSTLTLPAGTSCSVLGRVVTCTTATLANGASIVIPITASINPGTAAGTLVNSATVSSNTTDSTTGNNTATTSTTVTRNADLALTKTGPSSVVAGSQPTYTLTVTNLGPSSATSTTVTDTLPTGLTRVTTTPSQGLCSATGQTISCALGTIAPAGTATVAVKVTVAASFTGASITNTASVANTTPDTTPGNNSASKTSTVTQDADLAVTKTVAPTTATAGNTVTYTVDVADLAGGSDARGVVLADTIPSSLILVSATPTRGTCTSTSPVSCTLGLITPGTSAQVAISARVKSTTSAGTVTNTASATTTTAESVTGNNASAVGLTVVTRADLSLTKTADPDPVQLGDNLTYTLTAANNGPSQARGVVITDPLPAGTTFVSASPGCTETSGTVSCTVGTVETGSAAARTITVDTPQDAPAGTLTNTASVAATTTDPATDDNTASFVSSTASSADLDLDKTTSPSPVVAGQDVTYRVAATNRGPSTASDVRVLDTLPSGVSYRSSSIGGGGSCSRTGPDLSCALGSLSSDAFVVVTIVGHVDADLTATSTSNTATVSATDPSDPTPSNNSATSTSTVTRSADVGVSLATTPTVRAGEDASFRIVVTNAGPATSRGAVVTVSLPAELRPVPGSLPENCSATGQSISCTLGTLAVSGSTAVDFSARVLAGTPAGDVSATASVGATTADPNPENNSAAADLSIATASDVVAAITVAPQVLVAGSTAIYTLTATNNGPSDAVNVMLADDLPDGVSIVSATPNTGSCTTRGPALSCISDRVTPGSALTVNLVVSIDPAVTGSVTNEVVASSAGDSDTSNDTASITNEVQRSADLRLTKTASPDPVSAGGTLHYALDTINVGPATATGVVLDDTLPDGVQLLADGVDAPPGVTCTTNLPANRVTCTLGDLAVGVSVSVTLSAQVAATTEAGATFTNSASLTSPTPAVDLDARTASVTVTVDSNADLSVTKTGLEESPIAGGGATYLVDVHNNGPSVARAAGFVDTLSDSLSFDNAINPAGGCAPDGTDVGGSRVRCTLGDLQPGQDVQVRLNANVDPASAGGFVEDTVQVSSDTPDPTSDNNSQGLAQPISGQNDLELTKTLLTDDVVAGQPVTYLLTVTNHGPSQARNVSMTDVLPDLLGYTSATAAHDGDCSYHAMAATPADDDQVGCSWDRLNVDDSATVTVTLTVPANCPGDSIANTATATSSATDPTPATATVVTPVSSRADLSLRKTLLSGTPTAGQEMRWQLALHNDGPSTAHNANVLDPTPAGLTFTAADSAGAACSVTSGSVACALGDVAVGDDVVVTVSGILAADFSGAEVTNAAAVSSDTTDPDPGDNSASLTSPAGASADLSVTKSAAPELLTAGENVTWTMAVADAGPSDTRDVVLTDELPDGVTLVSTSFDGQGTCSGSRSLVCLMDLVGSGSTRVLTVVGRLDPGYPSSTVANIAQVSSGVADPDPLNNTATATSEVGHSADLIVAQTGTASVQAGENVSWQVDLANAGPSDAAGVVVVDDLPAGLVGATGSFPGGVCSVRARTMTCPVGAVSAAGHVVVTVLAQVDPGTSLTSLTNTSIASADTADPDSTDLTAGFTTAVDRSADLALAKIGATDTFTAGNTVGWVLTVRNLGPSLSRTVTVQDPVPDGVSDVTATAGAGSCTVEAVVLSCTVGDVAPGAPVQIAVSGTLSASYADLTLVNQATVVSETTDPNPTDDVALSETSVQASADLSLGKSLTSGPPVAGEPVSYLFTVHNAGPSDGHDVVVTDSVPAVIEDLGASTPDGSCSFVDHDLTCLLPGLANGGDAAIELTGVVAPDYLGELSNSAGVASTDLDPELLDNVGTSASSVSGSADLGLTKSGPDTVVAGERATWTLAVSNAGPSTARNVTLVDDLPAGLTDTQVETTTGTCSIAMTCELGDIGPGQPVLVTVSGRVATGQDGPTLANTAAVASDTADPSSTDNTSRTSTEVTQSADLIVIKTSNPTQLRPGTDATYTVLVENGGSSTARLVSVTDTLPEGVALRGAPTSAQLCRVDGRTVSCETDHLDPGSGLSVTIPVTVAAGFADASIVNAATARSVTPEANPVDNTATATSPIAGQADLTLRKTAPAEVTAGEPSSWQLDLDNAGPSDAQDTVLTDTLPEGVGDVVAVSSQGSCSQSGRLLSCSVGVLATGGSVHVEITTVGVLDPGYVPGDITNTAEVTSPTADPDGGEGGADGRTASATTTVTAAADVTVTKVADQTSAVPGGPVGWTITVVNTGPSTARGVELQDVGVAGLSGFTLTPPDGVTCAAGVCAIGTLAPRAEHAVVFAASADVPADDARDSVANTATASASTDDPDPGDNSATASVSLEPSAGVSVTKKGPDTVTPGRDVSWDLTVTNGGPSLARGVELSDTIPASVTGLTVEAPDGVTCAGGHALRCAVGDLAAGAERAATVRVTGTLAATLTGPELTNTATVSAGSVDPNAADNSSTTGATVTSRADLSLTKTGPAQVTAGNPISWTLTAHNAGPGQARNVVVTDALPAGVEQITTGSPEDGLSCAATAGIVRCVIATLDAGADKAVPVSGVVAPGFTGATLTNVGRIGSDATDPDPTNNTSPAAITSGQRSADVSLTKAVTPSPIEAGRPATFTLTVSNAGPSTARGVTVTDPVPAGMTIGEVHTSVGACAVVEQRVTCVLGELAATDGTPVVITIPVAVGADVAPGAFVNTASVTTTDPDLNPDNNTAQVSGDSAASADLSITDQADRDAAVPGGPITWAMKVHNAGPATARGVQVLAQLPYGVNLSTVQTSVGTCSVLEQVVSCALGDVRAGADDITVTVPGLVPADSTLTSLTSSASVAAIGSSDPDLSNNQRQTVTPLAGAADLTLTKHTDTATLVAGRGVQWTLTASNAGPSTAYDVVLTDIVPAAPSAYLPAGCTVVDRTLRCLIGTVPVGGTATRVITATVDPSQIGQLSNTAVLSSAAADPHPGDNTATTAPAPVGRVADVSVTKTVDASMPTVGGPVTYRVRVRDAGPSDATGVVVQETWPAGVTFVSASTAAGAYDPATQRWTVGTLTPGETEELDLVGTVTRHGGLRNRVGVLRAAGYGDPTVGNNVAEANLTLPAPAGSGSRPGSSGGTAPPGAGQLPNTGGPSAWLMVLGWLGVSAGVVLLTVRRRRRV